MTDTVKGNVTLHHSYYVEWNNPVAWKQTDPLLAFAATIFSPPPRPQSKTEKYENLVSFDDGDTMLGFVGEMLLSGISDLHVSHRVTPRKPLPEGEHFKS